MTQDEAKAFFANEAHVAINDGRDFGEDGSGFFRLNLASPRYYIAQVMENIYNVIRSR